VLLDTDYKTRCTHYYFLKNNSTIRLVLGTDYREGSNDYCSLENDSSLDKKVVTLLQTKEYVHCSSLFYKKIVVVVLIS